MPIRVQILLLPSTMLSTLAGPLDLFTTAGVFWPMLMGQNPAPLFEVELVSVTRETMQFPGGLTVQPQCDLTQAGPADVVYIPSILIAPGDDLPPGVQECGAWLCKQYEQGAMLCSACTGSFVLAQSGLLNGLPATTHWALGLRFQSDFPDIQLQENAVLVANENDRLITAGANASWQDLILYVIEKTTAQQVAEETRRVFLIDSHDSNQGAYSRCTLEVTTADSEIARAQKWLHNHLRNSQPVEKVVERSNLPSRTFKRRFKKHVGMSIIAYVQMLRVDAAKALLLTSSDSIDTIALAVGYQDAGYFRKIFNRETGIRPSQYRSKYKVQQ